MDSDELEEQGSEEQIDLPSPDVITKYQTAGDIVNRALAKVISEVKPGAKLVDLCVLGDKTLEEGLGAVYNKTKGLEKGIAFPTSISVNHCVGHYSPLTDDTIVLAEGDVVKIDLGAHIDGLVSQAAHTAIATSTPTVATTGRKADIIAAAHYAGEIAHRLIKPGKKNTDVTEAINKVAEEFKVNVVEGVLSHQIKRFVIDGNKVIIGKSSVENKVEEFEFSENEAYVVDIVMSTGEGKPRELDTRTFVYKRAVEQNYQLKMQASRYVFNEINKRFPTFPFSLRALDEKKGKLGVTEMLKHGLLHPYPVLYEKQGEFVAQFKFTVLILPASTARLNAQPLPYVTSEFKLQDAGLVATLALGTKRGKKNKKKSSKKEDGKEEKEGEAKSGKEEKAAAPAEAKPAAK